MATSANGRAPCESGETGEEFRKRLFRSEINEEPPNVSHEVAQNFPELKNLTGASELSTHQGGSFSSIPVAVGKSELEQILTQMTFTRSENQRFISLLQSRTMEETPTPPLRLEASTTTGSMKRHKHGEERDNFHASFLSSRILEEAMSQDSKLINHNGTGLPITSMVSQHYPTTLENIPNELLVNIFIRLMAKQLAQMRSVSKSWNALLSQSSFIKSHLHYSIHNNDQILLVFHDEEESSSDSKPYTVKPSLSPCLELTNFIKLPVNPHSENTNGIRIIGSVNGLICSCYGDSVIHIWNPSLSAVLTLPSYSTPSRGDNPINIHFRFGFDPKTDDYKVVKLTGLTGKYVVKWWLQIEIYSMRKGSWELITERFPSHITYILNNDYVCVDGHDAHLHWLGFISEKIESERIVAFDLGSETFREIPLPDSTLNSNRLNVLGVLAEKLCVISHVGDDGTCEVWVIEEYGVTESWVKRHVFSQFSEFTSPFGFTSDNKFLIEEYGYLVFYDPSSNEQKILEDHCLHKIVEYVDSLVWVSPAEHGKVDGGGKN